MKKFLIVGLMSFFALNALAQSEVEDEKESFVPQHNYNYNLRPSFKPSFGLNTGASFGRWGQNNFFSTYINPELSQQLSNRFILSTGVFIMRNNFGVDFSSSSEGSGAPLRNNFNSNQAIIYGSGTYLLSDRMTVTGSAFYSMNEQNPYLQQFNGQNGKGFSMGFDYKVSDKVSIGAGIRYSEGMNMWGNPMMMQGPGMFGPQRFGTPGGRMGNMWW
jgi:hypothetical protein